MGGGSGYTQTTKVLSVNSKTDRLPAALGKRKPAEAPNFCSLALAADPTALGFNSLSEKDE